MADNKPYVQRIATAGNGLFASYDIEPGSQVLTIARPLIAIPDTPHLEDTCSNCFIWAPGSIAGGHRDVDRVMPCTSCKVVRYCGKVGKVSSEGPGSMEFGSGRVYSFCAILLSWKYFYVVPVYVVFGSLLQ